MNKIMMLEFTTLNSVGWPHISGAGRKDNFCMRGRGLPRPDGRAPLPRPDGRAGGPEASPPLFVQLPRLLSI